MSGDNDDWLADVVVINDTDAYGLAGDVQIFRNVGELIDYLESWYVEENHEHYILTGTGRPMKLGLEERSSWRGTWKDIVVADDGAEQPSDVETLMTWLTAMAEHLRGLRQKQAEKGKVVLGDREKDGALPSTVEGLIAYIGFS